LFDFCIKIADVVVEIKSEYYGIVHACRDFIVTEQPDFSIVTSQEDFDVVANESTSGLSRLQLCDVYLEITACLKKISDLIVDYDTFMMHGAVIAMNNEAYMFTGKSGTGKTTHIKKWLDNIPEAFVVNGDKPFIRTNIWKDAPLVCGSPWAGKENLYTNTMVPIKAIVIMNRSNENRIREISYNEAFFTLLQQVHRPNDEKHMRQTIKLLQRLKSSVSFWDFQFNNQKEDCFQVAYDALVGGQT